MSRYLCHDRPEQMSFETEIVAAEPGAVLLAESLFYPGGGGQLADRGTIAAAQGEFAVTSIEIAGLDQQAWAGTHLSSTGQSRPVRILKIENKGRHNRRIRIGLIDPPL